MTPREESATLNKYRRLVVHVLSRYRESLSVEDYEELESNCFMEVFRALAAFDESHASKASPDTVIAKYCQLCANHFISRLGTKSAMFNSGTVSLSTEINKSGATLESVIPSGYRDDIDVGIQMDSIMDAIKGRRRRAIMHDIAQGKSGREIGGEHGISRQRVAQIKDSVVGEVAGDLGRKRP